jgi:hypothetical protein
MDVNRTLPIAVVVLFLAMPVLLPAAQVQRSKYDPANGNQTSKPKDGFLDFTLKRINSSDKDFGKCVDEGRKILLQESIENGYFWSNVVALGLLGCLSLVVIYQHNVQTRREWNAAEMLGEFENALARANTQVEEATKRNHGLMEALAELRESALRTHGLPADVPDHPRSPAPRSRSASAPAPPTAPPKETTTKPVIETTRSAAAPTHPANQIGLFKPDVDLVMKVNSLEQQHVRSRDEVKLLRRQLNDAEQRVQAEQQKNRALKGE